MKLFFIRIFLTLNVIILIYLNSHIANIAALFISVVVIVLSYTKFYFSKTDKILGLLADKIFFCSVLVVFTDLRVLGVPLTAWVMGVVFVHSGIDLLQGSLTCESINFRSSWVKNIIHMTLTLLVLMNYSAQLFINEQYSLKIFQIISWAWFFFTVGFLISSIGSEKFRKMVKEA